MVFTFGENGSVSVCSLYDLKPSRMTCTRRGGVSGGRGRTHRALLWREAQLAPRRNTRPHLLDMHGARLATADSAALTPSPGRSGTRHATAKRVFGEQLRSFV